MDNGIVWFCDINEKRIKEKREQSENLGGVIRGNHILKINT